MTLSSIDTTAGNVGDYALGLEGEGFTGCDVVRFRSDEALNQLFTYDVWLARRIDLPALDPAALCGTSATFELRTRAGFRSVHGILRAFEQIEETETLVFHRVELVPHLYLATLRTHCRTFVGMTLETVLRHVLEHRTPGSEARPGGLTFVDRLPDRTRAPLRERPFETPAGTYTFAVRDTARLRDPQLRAYVVQYNETDFDFFCRLLEEEGLAFAFVHGDRGDTLVITDTPGGAPPEGEDALLLRSQTRSDAHEASVRLLSRRSQLSCGVVTLRDFDAARPLQRLEATAAERGADPRAGRALFPGRDEGLTESVDAFPARVALERERTATRLQRGRGTVRTLEPGITITIDDAAGVREAAAYVVVGVRQAATQHRFDGAGLDEETANDFPHQKPGDFACSFELLPADVTFRPPLRTPRPRIDGVHTAIVTAEEAATDLDVHCDETGRVRVRFPWDTRVEPGAPSSTFIRVSQGWAGAGHGFFALPRIGHEVLVAYLQGDPERPVIVGRVHNAATPQPYALPEHKTVSTLRTKSSPAGDGFNELRFEDKRGEEEVFLHAERDLRTLAKRNADTDIGGDVKTKIVGSSTTQAASVSVGTGAYDVSCSDGAVRATGDITLAAGDERKDLSANHNVKTGGLWVEATSVAQFVTPTFKVMATTIELIGAGGTITIGPGGISIKGSVVDVVGAPIKLNS